MATIDTDFDFRTDADGKDPDSHSPTLRRYHKLLWGKALPSGVVFALDDKTRGAYLHHKSDAGEFFLASDGVMQTFIRWVAMEPIIAQFSRAETDAFMTIGYTIGGMMIFPGDRVDGMQTINGARGFNRRIADRMDLTLECIRRHYAGEPPDASPLGTTLARYRSFFELFVDFRGYVEFFLLQDLARDDCTAVEFLMPFEDFTSRAVPRDVATYAEFMRLSIEFIRARNCRIAGLNLSDEGP